MSTAEAESILGPRAGGYITAGNIATFKKWLTAQGVPGVYANRCPKWLANKIYRDASNAALAEYKARAELWVRENSGAMAAATAIAASAPVAPFVPPAITIPSPVPAAIAAATAPTPTLSAPATVASGKIDVKTWDNTLVSLKANSTIPRVINRVLLYGPPRTGKSTGAAQIFSPAERITFHKQQPTDDLLGGYCLRDGATVWNDGPAVRAMRGGKALVIDEIDQYSPECRFTLHALLDDPAAITLASGERVEAAPGYMVLATTNAQPSMLAQPILDRFDIILYCATLSAGLRDRLDVLADAAQRSVAESKQWTRPASPNLYLTAAKLRRAGMDDESIAKVLYSSHKSAQADLVALLATARK